MEQLINYQIPDYQEWGSQTFPWTQKIFGKQMFHQHQKEIINITLQKKDVFVCLPTGYGKSLTYQIPAVVDGLTIVITPLLSIMTDQTLALEHLGIQVANTNQQSINQIYQKINQNNLQIIITTPEKFEQNDQFKLMIQTLYNKKQIQRFVIDEAHCVSKWGRDFRPDYMKLSLLKKYYPDVPIMALTATATKLVKNDIINILNIKNCYLIQGSFNRVNLYYDVRKRENFLQTIESIYQLISTEYSNKAGIIYCLTKKDSELVSDELKKYGLKIDHYHAGLTEKQRHKVHVDWIIDELKIIVATVAFGMGIDKPDCRFVIHYSMPSSLENYHQESGIKIVNISVLGRAGRDGQKGHCILYYNPQDYQTNLNLLSSTPNFQFQTEKLSQIQSYCLNQTTCRRKLLLEYFGNSYLLFKYIDENFDEKNCQEMCSICQQSKEILKIQNCSEVAQKIFQQLNYLSITEKQLICLLKGQSIKATQSKIPIFQQSPLNGLMKQDQKLVEPLISKMIGEGILEQKQIKIGKENDNYQTSFLQLKSNQCKAHLLHDFIIQYKEVQAVNLVHQDFKSKIMLEKSKQNFANYLKKSNSKKLYFYDLQDINENGSVSKQIDLMIEATLRKDKFMNKMTVVCRQILQFQSKSLLEKMKEQQKSKVYHPLYGFCSESQFQNINAKIKNFRREQYKALYLQDINQENLPSIETILANEDIDELCRKLPANNTELLDESVFLPLSVKQSHLMTQIIQTIEIFVEVEKIKKDSYYYLQQDDLLDEQKEPESIDIQEEPCQNNPSEINNNLKRADPIQQMKSVVDQKTKIEVKKKQIKFI